MSNQEALRQRIIEAHIPMAKSIAKRYAQRGMPLDRLTETAVAALHRAADHYHESDTHGFSLYASKCIRQALVREIANADIGPRLSVRTVERLSRAQKSIHQHEQALGRPLTQEELTEELSVLTDEDRTQILNYLT